MPRFNVSVVLAACIVAASLIASALIISHRMAASVSGPSSGVLAVKPAGTPPIAQASVEEQFLTQVLAAPTLHSCRYSGRSYTMTKVKVSQAIYTAAEDKFDILCDWVWQPAMPLNGPQSSYCDLTNDGYGHYYGFVTLDPTPAGPGPHADITIK